MAELVLVSDIHGNYPALQAVVDKEGSDKEYVVLGDIHGLLAYPEQTQQLVKDVGDVILAGNHDKALFEKGEGHVNSDELSAFELEHTLSNLDTEQQEWAEELPHMEVLQKGQSRIAATHAYPWPEQASGYEAGNAGVQKRNLTKVASVVTDDYDYVLHGHTHEQYDVDCAKFQGLDVHFVNPGTLGYKQTYSTLDTETGDVSHKSVDIDWDEVKAHVQAHLPEDAPSVETWL
jgi:predicted phosphodiesterase